MPKLSPDELAGAEVIGKLSPEDMAGAERVTTYPNSPRMSKNPARKGQHEDVQDENERLGLDSGPMKTEGVNFGAAYGLAPHEVNAYDAMGPVEKENFKRQRDEAGKAFIREIAGQTIGSAILPVGEGVLAPVGRKIVSAATGLTGAAGKAAPQTFEIMKKAIAHSAEEGGKLALVRAVGSDAAAIASKAGSAVAPAAAATTRAAAVGAGGGVALSPLSNAVDKLRASAGISPSAMDFTKRMQAASATPNGTVTQGTLGGEP